MKIVFFFLKKTVHTIGRMFYRELLRVETDLWGCVWLNTEGTHWLSYTNFTVLLEGSHPTLSIASKVAPGRELNDRDLL